MGSVYRRSTVLCVTCRKRLFKTGERKACKAASHEVKKRKSPTWWISYKARDGWHDESSHSEDKIDAQRLLRDRQGAADRGHTGGPYSFEDAAAAVVTDYQRRRLRSLNKTELHIREHLTPFFGGRVLSDITTVVIDDYGVKLEIPGYII